MANQYDNHFLFYDKIEIYEHSIKTMGIYSKYIDSYSNKQIFLFLFYTMNNEHF